MTPNSPRFSSTLALVVASAALALSTWTACERSEVRSEPLSAEPASAEPASAEPASAEPASAEPRTPNADLGKVRPSEPQGQKREQPSPTPPSKPTANSAANHAASKQVEPRQDTKPPKVKRLVITHSVEDREPAPLGDSAKLGEPLLAFIELANPNPQATKILVTFEHSSGTKVGFVKLDVPENMKRYRTWARTQNIKSPGQWSAVVTGDNGAELARQSFSVEG